MNTKCAVVSIETEEDFEFAMSRIEKEYEVSVLRLRPFLSIRLRYGR